MSGRLPYMQFYPADWMADPALAACSLPAQGLWFRLLCRMWLCPERGVLKTGKEPWGMAEIALDAHTDVRTAQELVNELVRQGVTGQRESDGAFINRRMVRDQQVRDQTRNRVKRHRDSGCNGDVTGRSQKSDFRSQKSEEAEAPASAPAYQGKWVRISAEQHARLVAAFPDVDVQRCYSECDLWQDAHPSRRKENQYSAMLNWLKRERKYQQENNREAGAGKPPATNSTEGRIRTLRGLVAKREKQVAEGATNPRILEDLRLYKRNLTELEAN